ncbi:hypothetical protein ACIPF8_10505 [Collimonas sp. NPDC087041]|uniref:hypothetical protein n=1 Tax=Collimonas sp. NPDC087041 TaxID=3363960 RepID=UPI0037F9AE73
MNPPPAQLPSTATAIASRFGQELAVVLHSADRADLPAVIHAAAMVLSRPIVHSAPSRKYRESADYLDLLVHVAVDSRR